MFCFLPLLVCPSLGSLIYCKADGLYFYVSTVYMTREVRLAPLLEPHYRTQSVESNIGNMLV